MICNNCGKIIEGDYKYCPECGKQINIVNEENNDISQKNIEDIKVKKDKINIRNLFLKFIIATVGICAIIEIILIAIGNSSDVHLKLWGTVGLIILYSVFINNSIKLYEKNKYIKIAILGIIISIVEFIDTILRIWIKRGFFDNTGLEVSLVIIVVAFYHIIKLLLIDIKNDVSNYILKITIFITSITYFLAVIKNSFDITNIIFKRVLWIFAIMCAFGTVSTYLSNKIYLKKKKI